MKVIQMLTTISYGDAVGNDVLALHRVILRMGYETGIYAENIDLRLPKDTAKNVHLIPPLKEDDVIIYHLSTGTRLNYELENYPGRKVIVYHNITPPAFFDGYSSHALELSADGLRGMAYLADTAEYCLAVSSYNKQQLLKAGYTCRIDVLPILIPFRDYEKKPAQKIIKAYAGDGYTNLLFTGRIAPNKRQEDVIRTFYFYKKYYNEKSRLFLVGSYAGMERYYQRLLDYIDRLELEQVYFTGHIRFEEILAYYHIADAFVCMSEHEGFCVPLIEAMYFNIPVIAYDSSAIADTLGGSGFLTATKDPLVNAGILNRILQDQDLRETMLKKQAQRLHDFRSEAVEEAFQSCLNSFLRTGVVT